MTVKASELHKVVKNLLEKALSLPTSKIKKLGEFAIELITEGTESGLLQDAVGRHSYLDKKYVEKKRAGLFPRQRSRRVSSVDMTLTGDLIDSLKVVEHDNKHAVLKYTDPKAETKISHNLKYGRDITTLNDDNVEKTRQKLIDYYYTNINEIFKKYDEINV